MVASLIILANARWDTEGRGGNSSQQYAIAGVRQGLQVSYIQKDKVNHRTPLEEIELDSDTVVMCDMPWVDFYFDLFMKFKALGCRTAYRIVDNWAMTKRREEYSQEREEEFIRQADAVFASHPLNMERFKHIREDIYLLRNGVDLDMLWQWQGLPPEDVVCGKPTAVFAASFWDPTWVDWDALRYAAEQLPDMALNIIGDAPQSAVDGLPGNIHLLGRKDWRKLPAYFSQCDAGLVAYDKEKAKYNNPIKVLEYLATRLPVVAYPNASFDGYPYIFTYESKEELPQKIQEAAAAAIDADWLYNELKKHHWIGRLRRIWLALGQTKPPTPLVEERRRYSLQELLEAQIPLPADTPGK